MDRIRDDVVGVFHTSKGVLKAGDEVPAGVVIHERYLDDTRGPDVPRANASAGIWRDFLTINEIEFPEDAKRDELREIWENAQ